MRGSGRTTRIIDKAIQDLFKNGKVTIIDHHYGGDKYDSPVERDGANRRASKDAFRRMVNRLIAEHGKVGFRFDESSLTVFIIK